MIKNILKEKIGRIRLIVTDFDGVWTDGKVYCDADGREMVRCSRRDTLLIPEVKAAGIGIFVISKETNPVVSARCRKMGVECRQGVDGKLAVLEELVAAHNLSPDQVAYVGDDINDLRCLKYAGFPITVNDGHPRCKVRARVAGYVTKQNGGDHAMREVFDLFLNNRS